MSYQYKILPKEKKSNDQDKFPFYQKPDYASCNCKPKPRPKREIVSVEVCTRYTFDDNQCDFKPNVSKVKPFLEDDELSEIFDEGSDDADDGEADSYSQKADKKQQKKTN